MFYKNPCFRGFYNTVIHYSYFLLLGKLLLILLLFTRI